MTVKRWQKKTKAREEILTTFNSQNSHGIKRDLSQLQGCWRRIAMTNGLDVDGVKLLSVNKCHSILFVWTHDPDVGTIDGPDHIWIPI